jgi:hypothetical protein
MYIYGEPATSDTRLNQGRSTPCPVVQPGDRPGRRHRERSPGFHAAVGVVEL